MVVAWAVGWCACGLYDPGDAHHTAALAVVGVTSTARGSTHAGIGWVGVIATTDRRCGAGTARKLDASNLCAVATTAYRVRHRQVFASRWRILMPNTALLDGEVGRHGGQHVVVRDTELGAAL